MASEEKEQKVGLDHLSDEALAAIVEKATEEGDLEYPYQVLAFEELARRSGHDVQ